jgi:hypothetical protein
MPKGLWVSLVAPVQLSSKTDIKPTAMFCNHCLFAPDPQTRAVEGHVIGLLAAARTPLILNLDHVAIGVRKVRVTVNASAPTLSAASGGTPYAPARASTKEDKPDKSWGDNTSGALRIT